MGKLSENCREQTEEWPEGEEGAPVYHSLIGPDHPLDHGNFIVAGRRYHRPILERLGRLLVRPLVFLVTMILLLDNEKRELRCH